METILITGGAGLIGKNLSKKLKENGYNVALLSRNPKPGNSYSVYSWNPEKNEIENEAIKSADYIIHLAGAGIGEKRWSKQRKDLIFSSRVKTCELLFDKVQKSGIKLKAFISASGTGYYGTKTSENIFSESDPPYPDFLGEVCRQWELAAERFEISGIRTVRIRTGIVLSKTGGALSKMVVPARFWVGSPLGSGRQYMPWIHIDDLCNIYMKAISDIKMTGAYNAVAPEHVSNSEFMRELAGVLDKPFFFPSIPSFVMKLLFGKMSDMLLYGSRISDERIISAGYRFMFPKLKTALENLYIIGSH